MEVKEKIKNNSLGEGEDYSKPNYIVKISSKG